jgi:hypothetical protein
MASADACDAMCSPSANKAIDPKTTPAAISKTIVAPVIAMTISVRSSPGIFRSCPKT